MKKYIITFIILFFLIWNSFWNSENNKLNEKCKTNINENYTIKNTNYEMKFEKNNKYWKLFLKIFPILKEKIELKNLILLENFLNTVCNKKISWFDNKKIQNLFNLIKQYKNLEIKILNDLVNLYVNVINKNFTKLKQNVIAFKIYYEKIKLIKKNIQNLSLIKFDVKKINIKKYNDNYISIKIIPRNENISINNNYILKVKKLTLLINKFHLQNINIKQIKSIYILWNITIPNKHRIKITKLYTILFK